MPGDSVVCCDPAGQIMVNDTPLDETGYLYTDPPAACKLHRPTSTSVWSCPAATGTQPQHHVRFGPVRYRTDRICVCPPARHALIVECRRI